MLHNLFDELTVWEFRLCFIIGCLNKITNYIISVSSTMVIIYVDYDLKKRKHIVIRLKIRKI